MDLLQNMTGGVNPSYIFTSVSVCALLDTDMFPNPPSQPGQQSPQPQPEYSIDYLDQISAPQKKTIAPNPLLLLGVIGVGILMIVGFAIVVFGSSGSTPITKATDVYLRLQTLQKIASAQQRELRDNDLRSTNAAFSLYLSNTLRDINEPITKLGIQPEKIPKTTISKEAAYTTEINTKFEEAKLNVMLDRTYAREMAYQIGVLRNKITSLYKATTSTSLKTALGTSDASLAQSAKSFEEFSGN